MACTCIVQLLSPSFSLIVQHTEMLSLVSGNATHIMLGRMVPWASWEEWHAVRNGLYSESWTQQQQALDKVRYHVIKTQTVSV